MSKKNPTLRGNRRGGLSRGSLLSATAPGLLLAALLLASCNSPNPVEPVQQTPPPAGGGSFKISLTSSLPVIPLGGTAPAVITVAVTRVSDNKPAAGLRCGLTTSLGSFNASQPVKVTSLTLDDQGTATASLFPGTDSGTATLLAQVDTSLTQLDVPIQQLAFFVQSVEPNLGVAEGGTKVRIHGGGFTGRVRVTFNNVASPSVDRQSDTLIVAMTPRSPQPVDANSTLTVNVTVTNAIDKPNPISDTLPGGFTYTSGSTPIQRPVVFSVTPSSGSNTGGQTVSIAGSFLPAAVSSAQVTFGVTGTAGVFEGLDAQVLSASASLLRVITPAASGLGQILQNRQVDVLVRNRDTGFFTVSQAIYRYGDDLFITDVQPRSASVLGGTKVTIIGRGFQAPVDVRLAGVPQQFVSAPYSCSSPAGSQCIDVTTAPVTVANCGQAPSGPVTVTNLGTGQTATSSVTFTYTSNRALLTSISPTSGPAAGGFQITLQGNLFPVSDRVRVTLNGVSASGVVAVSTQKITATAPPFTGAFDSVTCTAPNGTAGTRFVPKAVDVQASDLDSGCSDTLSLGFSYLPADSSCRSNLLAPMADFTWEPTIGQPLLVKFSDQSKGGQPTQWAWDFGDGVSSTLSVIFHTYQNAGTYQVTLTVSNAAGSSSITKSVTVPIPVSPQARAR